MSLILPLIILLENTPIQAKPSANIIILIDSALKRLNSDKISKNMVKIIANSELDISSVFLYEKRTIPSRKFKA